MSWLNYVYNLLYPNENIHHVPMFYEKNYEINVFGEAFYLNAQKVIIQLLRVHIGQVLVELCHRHVIRYMLVLFRPV